MRVVWISHSESLSAGAELCLWEGARGLAAEGHEVRVVVPAPGRLAERLQSVNVAVTVIPYRWWMHARFRLPFRRLCRNVPAARRLARLLRQLRPDVVITNTLAVPIGAFAARWAGIPHVWHIHEFGLEDHGLAFDFGNFLSLSCINRLSNRVIVNSRAVFAKFRPRIPESKLRLIYYAAEIAGPLEQVEAGKDPFRLSLVGRICPGKRQEDAVRAVSWLAQRGLKVRLSLVGNENLDYGRFLRCLAKELGVGEQIEFVAFTENPSVHFARSHVALVCSRSEAFGRVTIEAMKLGKPVVGADGAATSELIRDGVTGFLYKPGDGEDLGAKIEALYRNWLLLGEMGENAKDWSRRTFNMANYTSALLEVLEEAVAAYRQA